MFSIIQYSGTNCGASIVAMQSPSAPQRMPPLDAARMTSAQRAAADELIAGPRKAVKGPFIPMLRCPELMARTEALLTAAGSSYPPFFCGTPVDEPSCLPARTASVNGSTIFTGIGAADDLKGQVPVGFLCLNKGTTRPHADIVKECVRLVRDRIGPVAAFKTACVVDRLPKTRSGKILRGTMVKIADGQDFKMPATIDDPVILTEIATALRQLGYPNP